MNVFHSHLGIRVFVDVWDYAVVICSMQNLIVCNMEMEWSGSEGETAREVINTHSTGTWEEHVSHGSEVKWFHNYALSNLFLNLCACWESLHFLEILGVSLRSVHRLLLDLCTAHQTSAQQTRLLAWTPCSFFIEFLRLRSKIVQIKVHSQTTVKRSAINMMESARTMYLYVIIMIS